MVCLRLPSERWYECRACPSDGRVCQYQARRRSRGGNGSYSPEPFDCNDPYDLLDKTDKEIADYENQMLKIQESASLFEVNVPDFKQIKQCRKELRMLKQLWDYVAIVETSVEDWKTTPWRKIDVENMDIECKKFAKEIRAMDKEMRTWDTYTTLESMVKNMLTSLRAVGELQNPAIRERHWHQLMKSTKVLWSRPFGEIGC
uniref:Dynein heavy chain linker domain-containing protein n=1 Tax=Timema bartmani TaxID=61472 RepID=A0A7R9EV64_9NEOP|nr:unnamed protein product [Timema bartmani]